MNSYGIVVLLTLVITCGISVISELLNIRASRAGVPDEFSGLFDEDAYRKSQEYLRETSHFSLFRTGFDLALLLLFWFSGGFNLLDEFLRAFGFSSLATGLLYIGTLLFAQSIVALPFSIFRTFVIEEKFGFNKSTPGVFLSDLLKSFFLAVLLGGPVLAGVLWFFQEAGPMAWLWAWAGLSIFSLLLQYVAPGWIMPLFNKFVPLEDGELKSSIMSYAAEVNFPLSGISVIDGSRRSSKANAFFTGFGKRKRIALFDTLVSNHPVQELVAVLAHEIGHFKKKHIIINMALSLVNLGALFFLLSLFLNNTGLFEAFYMKEVSVYGSLIFFMLLYAPVEFVLSLFLQLLSRRHEFEADSFAVSTYREGGALADALKKLSRNNLSNLTPHPLYVFFNYSHPPVLSRITRIREHLAKQSK
jgi:STE24 endopeptidase